MGSRILAIGEVLWDLLPSGRQLGGAPANFAYHCHALGAEARLVSRVGDDPLGREILKRFRQVQLPIDTVAIDTAAPTGTVPVELGPGGQPRFTITENVAWDRIKADAAALELAASADAIYFGSLAQRSEPARQAIRKLVAASPQSALKVFDANLRPPFVDREVIEHSLTLANLLKLNDQELTVFAEIFGIEGSVLDQVAELAGRFKLTTVVLTRGERGSLLWTRRGWYDHPGAAVDVSDTVWAGDAFTSALTVGLLAGWGLEAINQRANEVAAYVCTKPGGMPELPERLRILPR
ncbi:MAG: carbohydrate kinase family protein [Isosphaeraceae bacterium]